MIILVIGPPASGKTSLAASQDSFRHIDLDKHLPTSLDLTIVSYKEARNKVVAELLSDIRGPTIFDDTFHLFSMRKPFMKKAAELGYSSCLNAHLSLSWTGTEKDWFNCQSLRLPMCTSHLKT